jgi:cell volume regulation protein A
VEPAATASILALIGALLIVASLLSPLSRRAKVPMLLVFLGIGMAAGSQGFGGFAFEDYGLAFRLGTLALVIILFDGGLNTPIAVFRRALVPAALLATVGVVLTAGALFGIGLLLGLPLPLAMLIAAIVSSTDAAAVFSALRSSGIQLRGRVASVLEVESGLNDPMAVVLTFTATEWVLTGPELGLGALASLVGQFVIGAIGGIVFGYGGRVLLSLSPLPATGLYAVLAASIALGTFGATSLVGGSGFLAVYVAGVILGKGHVPYRAGIRRFHDALSWLAQMLMFLVLGLLVFPRDLIPEALLGIALAIALAVIARPVAVLLTMLPFRLPGRERGFLAWVGLRGAVPIVLSAYPVLRGVPDGERIFHLVFFVVLVNAIIPGTTVGWLARTLGVSRQVQPEAPAGIDLNTARDFAGGFVWYYVTAPAAVSGSLVSELPLPERCLIVLLVRKDAIVPARGNTLLEAGDHVCLFVEEGDRPFVDLLFGLAESED